jgi:hypothetical protein
MTAELNLVSKSIIGVIVLTIDIFTEVELDLDESDTSTETVKVLFSDLEVA